MPVKDLSGLLMTRAQKTRPTEFRAGGRMEGMEQLPEKRVLFLGEVANCSMSKPIPSATGRRNSTSRFPPNQRATYLHPGGDRGSGTGSNGFGMRTKSRSTGSNTSSVRTREKSAVVGNRPYPKSDYPRGHGGKQRGRRSPEALPPCPRRPRRRCAPPCSTRTAEPGTALSDRRTETHQVPA